MKADSLINILYLCILWSTPSRLALIRLLVNSMSYVINDQELGIQEETKMKPTSCYITLHVTAIIEIARCLYMPRCLSFYGVNSNHLRDDTLYIISTI